MAMFFYSQVVSEIYKEVKIMAVHVTPHQNGWQVKSGGKTKAYRVVPTQKQAINIAKSVAKNQKTDTKIHGENGRIRAGNSYGNDPHPPKDTK